MPRKLISTKVKAIRLINDIAEVAKKLGYHCFIDLGYFPSLELKSYFKHYWLFFRISKHKKISWFHLMERRWVPYGAYLTLLKYKNVKKILQSVFQIIENKKK